MGRNRVVCTVAGGLLSSTALGQKTAAKGELHFVQILYDPKVVKLNDVGRGDFFSSDGQVPAFTKNIPNDAGSATINLNRLPGSTGVSGSGVLVTMAFQVVAPGTTTFQVPNLSVREAQGSTAASGTPSMTISVKWGAIETQERTRVDTGRADRGVHDPAGAHSNGRAAGAR